MFKRKKTMLYFAPHQDDELLTMGVDICRSVRKGCEVHVILCTDGGKSNVRLWLNNGKDCPIHPEPHHFEVSLEDFIRCRDQEFWGSCRALGVPESNIHLPENRDRDGSLSQKNAEDMIRRYVSACSGEITVCTISPNNGPKQHADHKTLGRAAENLLNKGEIPELKLFVEPYHYQDIAANPRLIPILPTIQKAEEEEAARIRQAVASYSHWDPSQGRYAVGYHSVNTAFTDYLQELTCYSFPKWREADMTWQQKLTFRRRKWQKLRQQKQLYYSMETCSKPEYKGVRFRSAGPRDQEGYRELCRQYNLVLRDKDLQRLEDGSYFGCLVTEAGEAAATGWLAWKHPFYIGETDFGFQMDRSDAAIFYDFNTKPQHRGNGYQGLLIRSLAHVTEGPKRFIAYTAPDNVASQHGMQKAGLKFEGALSAGDGSLPRYLEEAGFTKIYRKYQLGGLRVRP